MFQAALVKDDVIIKINYKWVIWFFVGCLVYLFLCIGLVWVLVSYAKNQFHDIQKLTLAIETCQVQKLHAEAINTDLAKAFNMKMVEEEKEIKKTRKRK